MRKNNAYFVFLLLAALNVRAQVMSPSVIKDPDLRARQMQHMAQLQQVGHDILAIQFPYPFYLSPRLDIDQAQQLRGDQNSIQFQRYSGQTIVAVIGNYYASYSTDNMTRGQRARETFLNVVVPILKIAVPPFENEEDVSGFGIEVAHHVAGKVMGVSMERPENLMVFLPKTAAIRLISTQQDSAQQAALLEAQAFLNGDPITLWINGNGPQLASSGRSDTLGGGTTSTEDAKVEALSPNAPGNTSPLIGKNLMSAMKESSTLPSPTPLHDPSPEALADLLQSKQDVIAQLVNDLDAQAHFVKYAAPTFVPFRGGSYLELSFVTTLPESAAGSRYKLAAMAFDDHVGHLIRPVAGYFKGDQRFDGVGFSTTIRLAGKAANDSAEAVEFFFPLSAMHCYEKFDCTGQQLIDAGTVLVNGERVGLDLQVAEGH